ncbi:MAG TPA: ABC transporter permease [Vicinamibacterales bacterium]|nr:ABC transporter permease [Vicinamibacterales bacterium]
MRNASVGTELGSAVAAPGVADAGGASAARAHAGLVWTLIRTDFKVRYHGTAGGFVWALLKPLTMFVLLMAVFSFLFASTPTYKLDLIIGLFLWDFFAESTKAGLISLHSKGFLLSKAKCPSWILVVTSISNAVITLAVFSVIIMVFLTGAGQPPSAGGLALFVIYCIAFALIVVGFSLGSSVLFLRYRDINQVWDMMIQAGFFIAPIIYPIAILPERFHFHLYFWPPTAVIEFARAVLVRGAIPTATAHLCLAGVVAISLALGWAIFRRLAPRAAEYL